MCGQLVPEGKIFELFNDIHIYEFHSKIGRNIHIRNKYMQN